MTQLSTLLRGLLCVLLKLQSYTPTADDVGHCLRVEVTANRKESLIQAKDIISTHMVDIPEDLREELRGRLKRIAAGTKGSSVSTALPAGDSRLVKFCMFGE